MIKWPQFRRKFCTFRISQLRELNDIKDLPELCQGSYLHILDNFQNYGMGQVNYGPDPYNPLLNINKWKLLTTNVNTPVEGVAPIAFSKMILTNAGLNTKLLDFKRIMMPRVQYFPTIKDLPLRTNAQRVVNFNSLFRCRTMGVRRKPRFFNLLLATLVNTIMKDQNGIHFIHIPLEALQFQRTDFAKVFRKYDRIATKYPECSTYLFLAHLYSILMKPMSLPPRGLSPVEEDEAENAEALENMKIDPSDVFDMKPSEFFTNIFNYVLGDPETAVEALKIRDQDNPYTLSIFEYLPPRMFEHINFILTCGGKYIIYNMLDLKEINGRSGAGLIRIIRHINMLTAAGGQGEIKLEEPEMVAEDIVDVDQTGTQSNQPEFVMPMVKSEKEEAALQDIKELDDFDAILNAKVSDGDAKPLTTAQKQHVATISHTYKHLEIGGKTFAQILAEIPEVKLTVPEEVIKKPEDQAAAAPGKPQAATGTPDKLNASSSTADLDANYVENFMDRDIAKIVTSFNKQGMFLVDFKEEEIVDELNGKKVYTAKYEDVDHKKHTIKFTLPKIDKFGRFKDNGSYKTINKQRVSNPITKPDATRITLNSNYNKLLVERNTNASHSFWNWFQSAMNKARAAGFKMMVVHGACKYPVVALPFELTEIGQRYLRINIPNGALVFDIVNRAQAVPVEYRTYVQNAEKENGVWFGFRGSTQFFITVTGQIAARDAKTDEEVFYGPWIDFMEWIMGIQLNQMVEFNELTILSRKVPLIHPLAYRYGLTNMLKYTGCEYEVQDAGTRMENKRTSDIVIKFSDKRLIIHRTPRSNALLFGGLSIYDFSNVMLEDMDSKDVYFEMLSQKGVSVNLIKGIDALFDLFIDPITKDILREMKEPTDLRDLLLRANTMLTTSDHKDAASASNFRFRGVEQISGIVYNEMAKAFATFKNKGVGATNHFSISEYQVKQRIAKEQLVENVAVINPLNDIKQYSKFSNSGSGGRSNDTFMVEDRQFTRDQIGVVSELTVDNGKTGTNATLPFDPIIVNERGMCATNIDITKLQPENILSITGILYPQITGDDSKRAGFCGIQASHYVPIKDSDVSRVRSGFEEVIARRVHEPCFAYAAKSDGKVVSIDDTSKTIVISENGKKTCLQYGSIPTNNAGSHIDQEVVINNFKVGDTFKKGDIVVYNHEFFKPDPYSKQVSWKMGILAKVALLDNGGTIEDASILTQPLCDRMTYNPIHMKEIVITTDTNVHAFADIGTHVNNTDPLMVFDQSTIDFGADDDPELVNLLSDLNKQAPKAGYTGTIMQIEAIYKSPLSEMSSSLQKIIKHVTQVKNARSAVASTCTNAADFQKAAPMLATTKVGTVDLTKDTVILRFYIKHNASMNPGDKLFFDSSLKSVCSTVYPEYVTTESGEKVEAVTSARGVLARLITSPFKTGIANSVLDKLESDVLAMWDSATATV